MIKRVKGRIRVFKIEGEGVKAVIIYEKRSYMGERNVCVYDFRGLEWQLYDIYDRDVTDKRMWYGIRGSIMVEDEVSVEICKRIYK